MLARPLRNQSGALAVAAAAAATAAAVFIVVSAVVIIIAAAGIAKGHFPEADTKELSAAAIIAAHRTASLPLKNPGIGYPGISYALHRPQVPVGFTPPRQIRPDRKDFGAGERYSGAPPFRCRWARR